MPAASLGTHKKLDKYLGDVYHTQQHFGPYPILNIFLSTCLFKHFKMEPFKYYVSKEVGGWGQKMLIYSTIYADVGGLV